MPETKKCAHPVCTCVAEAGRKYCSPQCEKASKTSMLTCSCGHAVCTAKAPAETVSAGAH